MQFSDFFNAGSGLVDTVKTVIFRMLPSSETTPSATYLPYLYKVAENPSGLGVLHGLAVDLFFRRKKARRNQIAKIAADYGTSKI